MSCPQSLSSVLCPLRAYAFMYIHTQVEKVLIRFDADGSGKVSIHEFMHFLGRDYTG
jgi:Ca2+-binding EF-hand superfamily protein